MADLNKNWEIREGGHYQTIGNLWVSHIALIHIGNVVYAYIGADKLSRVAQCSIDEFRESHLPTDVSPSGKAIEQLKKHQFGDGGYCPDCTYHKFQHSNSHDSDCSIGSALTAIAQSTVGGDQ